MKLTIPFLMVLAILSLGGCGAPAYNPTPYDWRSDYNRKVESGNWTLAYSVLESKLQETNGTLNSLGIPIEHYNKLYDGGFSSISDYIEIVETMDGLYDNDDIFNNIHDYVSKRIDTYIGIGGPKDEVENLNERSNTIFDESLLLSTKNRIESEKRRLAARQAIIDVIEAQKLNNITCRNASECRKAFSLAQIYVHDNSDQKIQLATDSIIETYNSTGTLNVAMKAIKKPSRGTSETITITAVCKGLEYDEDISEIESKITAFCADKLIRIYREFRPYVMESLR